jgi:predicted phosphodiesterase
MGRYAIISDIHGNRYAFEAVLGQIATLRIDDIICLGDVVGYGPFPGPCLDRVMKYCSCIVRGNHDAGVIDPQIADTFNGVARQAIYWTQQVLGPLHLNALHRMPEIDRFGANNEILCVHDNPYPAPVDYVHDKKVAALAFRGVDVPICLIGHTHVPMVYEAPDPHQSSEYMPNDIAAFIPRDGEPITLERGRRYICNPGAVGQPRDCDPRASFAVIDMSERTFTVHRVAYDVAAAQAAAIDAGLPAILADRLAVGA